MRHIGVLDTSALYVCTLRIVFTYPLTLSIDYRIAYTILREPNRMLNNDLNMVYSLCTDMI